MGWSYKGISSRYDYNGTFQEFQKEFENTWVFQKITAKDRLAELKKAFKLATENLKKVSVVAESEKAES